jgi:hypothetical protein
MEVQSYKEDNKRLMREKSQINARVLQSLNQLQRQTKKESIQDKRKKACVRKEEMLVEELVILEVLADLMDITHLLTQEGSFMHQMIL